VSSFSNAWPQRWTSLVDCPVNDLLVKLLPLLNQSCLDVLWCHECACDIHQLLQHAIIAGNRERSKDGNINVEHYVKFCNNKHLVCSVYTFAGRSIVAVSMTEVLKMQHCMLCFARYSSYTNDRCSGHSGSLQHTVLQTYWVTKHYRGLSKCDKIIVKTKRVTWRSVILVEVYPLPVLSSNARSNVQGRQWTSAWQRWSCWFYWFCWALLMKLRVAARRLQRRWVRATAVCCVRSTEPHRRYQSVIYGLQRRICHRKLPVLDTVPHRHLVTASTIALTSAPVSSTTTLQLNANRCPTAITFRWDENRQTTRSTYH